MVVYTETYSQTRTVVLLFSGFKGKLFKMNLIHGNNRNVSRPRITWCHRLRHVVTQGHRLALQWRHNGRDSVSNHQPHDCLLNRLFRCRSKKTSKLRVRWIPRTNGQKHGKGFHLMTSSWTFFLDFVSCTNICYTIWSCHALWLYHAFRKPVQLPYPQHDRQLLLNLN